MRRHGPWPPPGASIAVGGMRPRASASGVFPLRKALRLRGYPPSLRSGPVPRKRNSRGREDPGAHAEAPFPPRKEKEARRTSCPPQSPKNNRNKGAFSRLPPPALLFLEFPDPVPRNDTTSRRNCPTAGRHVRCFPPGNKPFSMICEGTMRWIFPGTTPRRDRPGSLTGCGRKFGSAITGAGPRRPTWPGTRASCGSTATVIHWRWKKPMSRYSCPTWRPTEGLLRRPRTRR